MPELPCNPIEIVPTRKLKTGEFSNVSIYRDKVTDRPPLPGDIFFAPWFLEPQHRAFLSQKYWALQEPRRDPIVVILPVYLPTGYWHCVDWLQFSGMQGYGGWDVTGTFPEITVHPSINIEGLWHGWLRAGVLRW